MEMKIQDLKEGQSYELQVFVLKKPWDRYTIKIKDIIYSKMVYVIIFDKHNSERETFTVSYTFEDLEKQMELKNWVIKPFPSVSLNEELFQII
jgi:hypothetical protein